MNTDKDTAEHILPFQYNISSVFRSVHVRHLKNLVYIIPLFEFITFTTAYLVSLIAVTMVVLVECWTLHVLVEVPVVVECWALQLVITKRNSPLSMNTYLKHHNIYETSIHWFNITASRWHDVTCFVLVCHKQQH